MNKKTKIAIISFIVLGVTGLAILKGREIVRKMNKKNNKKSPFNQLFELPEDLR